MTDHTKPLIFVTGGDRTKAAARKLGAGLLAWAGPERAEVLSIDLGKNGDSLTVRAGAAAGYLDCAVFQFPGYAAHLKPAQIDQLITWLQGHREDNP